MFNIGEIEIKNLKQTGLTKNYLRHKLNEKKVQTLKMLNTFILEQPFKEEVFLLKQKRENLILNLMSKTVGQGHLKSYNLL